MKLDIEMTLGAAMQRSAEKVSKVSPEAPTSFQDVMKTKSVAQENHENRDKVIAAQVVVDEDINAEDMHYINEHGMQAYADKVKAEKIEEMREKLMAAMGLTEEVLNAMSPKQRMVIEDSIDNTIQQRIAANSIMNADNKEEVTPLSDIDGSMKASLEHLKKQIHLNNGNMAQGSMGFASSAVLIDIIEEYQTQKHDRKEADTDADTDADIG